MFGLTCGGAWEQVGGMYLGLLLVFRKLTKMLTLGTAIDDSAVKGTDYSS